MNESVALAITAFIVICMILRFLYYHAKLLAILRHRYAYGQFLNASQQNPSEFQPFGEIAERQTEIITLFQEARQSPHQLTVVKPLGYGQLGTASTSAWENIHDPSHETASANLQSFHRTIGYFRARRNETFSPVFWIKSLLNWPTSLLGFLGFNREGGAAKFLQIVVLVLEFSGGVILAINNFQ
ncbi:MAG: hypothetical protein OXI34_10030 [Chloroflexota bacterium]|nr:hypothetical protein [Chloroflexota bacterium]MDE2947528.1 hypothetical protein [Chloroflexota bacterium]